MAIKVNGTTVIDDSRNLVNIASGAGGVTLLGTINTTSGTSITLSSLSLSSYKKLFIVGNYVEQAAFYSYIRIESPDGNSLAYNSSNPNLGVYFAFDLCLDTGYVGIGSYVAYDSPTSYSSWTQGTYGMFKTPVTNSSTSITFYSTGGFAGGSIKVYGL